METNKSYRAKSILNNEWVYGSAYKEINGKYYIINYDKSIEIDYTTICRCTGFHDKHGVDIYEYDIIAGKEYADFLVGIDRYCNCIITYFVHLKEFCLDCGAKYCVLSISKEDQNTIKIIGNKFDNPKLNPLNEKYNE